MVHTVWTRVVSRSGCSRGPTTPARLHPPCPGANVGRKPLSTAARALAKLFHRREFADDNDATTDERHLAGPPGERRRGSRGRCAATTNTNLLCLPPPFLHVNETNPTPDTPATRIPYSSPLLVVVGRRPIRTGASGAGSLSQDPHPGVPSVLPSSPRAGGTQQDYQLLPRQVHVTPSNLPIR